MPSLRRWRQSLLSIGVLTLLLVTVFVFYRNQLRTPQTQQAHSIVIDKVSQALDSPLPTAISIGTVEPTETPFPTVPPPPTPTVIPGPIATAWPLISPSLDATGSIIYPIAEAEIKPGYDTSITIYTVSTDKAGQPQGETQKVNGGIQVSGSTAIYVSPDGSKILIEDGWGIH